MPEFGPDPPARRTGPLDYPPTVPEPADHEPADHGSASAGGGRPAATVACATVVALVLIGSCLLIVACLLAGVAGLAVSGALLLLAVWTCGHVVVELSTLPARLGAQRPAVPKGSRPPDREPEGFWPALGAEERAAFLALALERTFPDGTEIFREGEPADHVVVVRSGQARIFVRAAGGGEHLIAYRGPGQILGERGALKVGSRSASVVAAGTVHAWLVPTGDFAAFVTAHPHVLDLLEGQIYDRLTEPRDGGEPDEPRRPPQGTGASRSDGLVPHPVRQRIRLNGETCTVVLTDIASFSDRRRNDDDRLFIREVLFTCVRRAVVDSGIPWERCHWEDRGDGLLLIVPAGIATTTVLESLPARVAFALHRHNRRSNAVGRIQLRLALHVGPVVSDRVGVSGDAIIHAARLLDASVFKRLIAGNQACLGLIVSDFVYHAMIRNGTAAVVPENYRRVQARVKQSQVTGWVAFHNPDPAPPQE